jgi:hypothetical protein
MRGSVAQGLLPCRFLAEVRHCFAEICGKTMREQVSISGGFLAGSVVQGPGGVPEAL